MVLGRQSRLPWKNHLEKKKRSTTRSACYNAMRCQYNLLKRTICTDMLFISPTIASSSSNPEYNSTWRKLPTVILLREGVLRNQDPHQMYNIRYYGMIKSTTNVLSSTNRTSLPVHEYSSSFLVVYTTISSCYAHKVFNFLKEKIKGVTGCSHPWQKLKLSWWRSNLY